MSSNEKMQDALQSIEKAFKTVADLCEGRIKWKMSIPANLNSDPDLIIADALQKAKEALAELDEQSEVCAQKNQFCGSAKVFQEMAAAIYTRPTSEAVRKLVEAAEEVMVNGLCYRLLESDLCVEELKAALNAVKEQP